jgi:predicted metal-dependent peptidase
MAEQIIRTSVVDLTVIVSWRAKACGEGHTFFERRFHYLEKQRRTSAGILKTKTDIMSAFPNKKRKFFIKTEIGTKHSEIQKNIVINLTENKKHKLFVD